MDMSIFLVCISQYSLLLPFFLLLYAFQSVMGKGATHNYAVKKSTFFLCIASFGFERGGVFAGLSLASAAQQSHRECHRRGLLKTVNVQHEILHQIHKYTTIGDYSAIHKYKRLNLPRNIHVCTAPVHCTAPVV